MDSVLVPIFAVVLTFLVPITALVGWIITDVNRKNKEKELKQAIVENKTDMEVVKMLFSRHKQQRNSFGLLRGACICLGIGLAALANYIFGIDIKEIYFFMILIAGVGLGLLVAFLIEIKMDKKKNTFNKENNENDENKETV